MAIVMTDERRAASRVLMDQLVKWRTSKPVPERDAQLNRPVVLALDHELWSTTVDRMHAYDPPVMLAVYYTADRTLRIYAVSVSAEDSVRKGRLVEPEQSTSATVGDVIRPSKRHMSVLVTAGETMGLTELVSA